MQNSIKKEYSPFTIVLIFVSRTTYDLYYRVEYSRRIITCRNISPKIQGYTPCEYNFSKGKIRIMEPLLTRGVSDELRDEIGDLLGKTLSKPDLDAVPLIMDNKAVLTGNAVKGIFRHLLSAQLTQAGIEVCVQDVKDAQDVAKVSARIYEPH